MQAAIDNWLERGEVQGWSSKTVQAHREHIKGKMKITNAAELVRHATQWVLESGSE